MILLPLFFLVYILVWVGLVIGIGVLSWRSSKSVMGTSVAVAIAFLVMYWPAFGDYFSTINAHKEYCEKEAGFKIYVTPEQWAAENPGVLETLVPFSAYIEFEGAAAGNERFVMKGELYLIPDVAVRKEIESFVDFKTKKIIAQRIDFSSGYWYRQPEDWRSIKTWLNFRSCYSVLEQRKLKENRMEFFKRFNTKWGY